MRPDRPCALSTIRPGFTLFEVAVSLGIVSVAVLSVLGLFPVGLKTQQIARYQLAASAKVLDICTLFADHVNGAHGSQVEADQLGQAQQPNYRNNLDQRLELGGIGYGGTLQTFTVPPTIANRLDSDNDEIQRILAKGGRLYYGKANFAADNVSSTNDNEHSCETQNLVFAIDGYPQQDAIAAHPCLSWPYFDSYPSPIQPWEYYLWTDRSTQPVWSAGWAAIQAVWESCHAGDIRNGNPDLNPPDDGAMDAYVGKAQALVAALGIPVDAALVPIPPAAMPAPPWGNGNTDVFPQPACVQAIRILAHAALLRTSSGTASTAQQNYARACVDSSLAWVMRYASTSPNDWGAPRPFNRAVAWNFPLLEYDIFPSAAFPSFTTSDGQADVSWKVIGRTQPVNYPHAIGYYGADAIIGATTGWTNLPFIDASWGDAAHFDLGARFDAAERTRQIIFWSVDWTSYEDFEEAPSAPWDARSCPFDSRGTKVMTWQQAMYHPEMIQFFTDATRSGFFNPWLSDNAGIWADAHPAFCMGLYGADRNGNGRYDRGPLPKSARLRATTIARFNYYDPRLYQALRN